MHSFFGADIVACLFIERIEHFPEHDIAAFETNLDWTLMMRLKRGDLLYRQAFEMQSTSTAADPKRTTQDATSASSVITLTGQGNKPPQ
ncbi:hypothetical protein NPIL_418391 [Nephila pilipes]|uniref:Uncharacterized protein n=1 Tax=Nephila pilipes TaxID=299642 RepID=A0A8X6IXP7_NEPPI|nr:hypothetical protein NPIL_418391 [Nephila pilipes]